MSFKVVLLVISLLIGSSQELAVVDTPQDSPLAKRAFCPGGAGDTDAGCPYWKELGFCHPSKDYLEFMEKTCPVSCGFCEARPTPPPQARLLRVDVHKCLRAHNAKRAMHGAHPLRWDWGLARDAEKWAMELANKDKFEHSPWSGQGENLYSTSKVQKEPITCEEAVEAWYAEVKDYPFNSPPRHVGDVPGKVIGHFTQVVWKSTTNVGVALSFIKRGLWYTTYVVARYTPPGNHGKQFAAEILYSRPLNGAEYHRIICVKSAKDCKRD